MLGPKAITAAILASAFTIGSTVTLAAPPMPASAETQSTVVHIQHRKSQKNWNRPQSPQPQPQRRKNNNEAIAIGVGIAAVLGAIALSQQAQSDDGARRDCRRLRWKCREGRGWACRRYDDLCN